MKKIISIIVISIIAFTSSWGQINNLYFNKKVYQSTDLNPARQHNCRFTLGLPAISSIYFDMKHTGFTYSTLFLENESNPGTFTPNINGFYENLNEKNYLFLHNSINLLNFSFWVREFYITFDADYNIQNNFIYPKSFFNIKDGTYFEDDNYISLTGFSEDFNSYASYAIGVSKEVIPGLTVGGKIRLLKGFTNFTTDKFQLDWYTSNEDDDIYDYTFESSFDLKMSTPFLIEPTYDDAGNINGINSEQEAYMDDLSNNSVDYIKSILLSQNTGFGVDLGVIYEINKMFELSASVTDLGFINWKTNPLTITTEESEFVFSGLDVGKYLNNLSLFKVLGDAEIRDSITSLLSDDMVDTLISLGTPTFGTDTYRKNLNAKLHFGAAFTPAKWVTLGFLYNGYLYKKELINSYTLSSTIMFWKGWSYTLSYTMFKQSLNNVGMGISYKIGPFQTYFMMNNIAVPIFGARYGLNPDKPYNEGIATNMLKNSKWLNMQLGINLMFSCKDRRDFGVID